MCAWHDAPDMHAVMLQGETGFHRQPIGALVHQGFEVDQSCGNTDA